MDNKERSLVLGSDVIRMDSIGTAYKTEVSNNLRRQLLGLPKIEVVTELKGLPGNPANYYFVKDPDGYKIEIIREK